MLCDLLVQTIEHMVENPLATVGNIEMIGEADRKQIMDWNRHLPSSKQVCVHDVILDICRATPTAPAISAWDGDLSYDELETHSAVLASHLQTLGVGPDVFIPILADKSMWVGVALLAVLRAGGAFVLLDPGHPDARLAQIGQTLGADVVICSSAHEARGAALGKQVVVVSAAGSAVWAEARTPPASARTRPEHAAYAVFTSGSTGTPKGVVIEHSHYATSGASLARRLHVTPTARVFQFASHAFDVSVSDYLTTLMTGGCICVPSETDRLNDLAGAVARLEANWMHLTPSVARTLKPVEVPGLDLLVLSGEAMQADNVQTWSDAVHLINAYGPAECSVDCVVNDQVTTHPDSIGTASAAVCWITDRHNPARLLPIGAVGELLVEGPIVGRGYLHDKATTDQAFITPPPWLREFRGPQAATTRVYRTGDLVQYRPDGALRYVGRCDHQLKIHGQRVELGEIEVHVGRLFPSSCGVMVEMLSQAPSQESLVAFVQWGESIDEKADVPVLLKPDPAFLAQARDVRARLLERLPQYMVPLRFVAVSCLPLTRSGKLDRARVRDLAAKMEGGRASGGPTEEPSPPLTPPEQQVQRLCAEVLGIPVADVDVRKDFFSAGGDSIKAMQLVSRARSEGLSFTVGQVLRSTPLAELARASSQLLVSPATEDVGHSDANLADNQLFRELPWHGLPFQEQDVEDVLLATELQAFSASRTQNYWFLELRGPLDTSKLKTACFALVERHAILRTAFVLQEGETVQIVLRRLEPVISELHTDEKDLVAFARAHSETDAASQTLYGAPPLRLTLIRRDNHHHLLAMRLSHAQYDGLSIPVLMGDLMALYEGRDLGGVAAPFAAFARCCVRSHTDEAFAFWRALLRGASMTVPLDSVAPPPSSQDIVAPTAATLVEVTTHARLPPPPPGITIATIIKTTWALAQARVLPGRPTDLVFGQLVSGRSGLGGADAALAAVVGPCLNLVPVRVRLRDDDGDNTVAALLRQVQDQHAASSAFETVALGPLTAHCTQPPWAPGTEFGSIVHHRPVPDQRQLPKGSGAAGAGGDALDAFVDAWSPVSLPGRSLWLSSLVAEDGRLTLDLYTRSDFASRELLHRLLGALCAVLRTLEDGFSMPVEELL